MASERDYHEPVMVAEVLEHLKPERGGLYFDGTVGGGGHTEAILRAGAEARVIGVDQDVEALKVAGLRLESYGDRVELLDGNFADAAETDSRPLAGALLDLGVSSHQLDEAGRGFSFRAGTALDMRMAAVAGAPTAADLLNDWPESDLADVFYRYGEERRSRGLAKAVVRRRRDQPFRTSDDLNEVIDRFYGPRVTVQDRARIYQALRIAVNDELAVLERALTALRDRLESAGVFVVLSYHSLEDRIVKDAFREWSRDCVCPPELPVCRCRGAALGKPLTRKPVMAGEDEVAANTRARSARLRAWKKAV
ncbi:MAG TPA: 16S rRNA (cytosine(1402)-N(4))-methyltransferase RsmH [Longimicrobiales bacterium]|nr:16S rRNA (cytosine(1402)-N(4))-methyltransferase RsmH [Longimicrobiales bacterium]